MVKWFKVYGALIGIVLLCECIFDVYFLSAPITDVVNEGIQNLGFEALAIIGLVVLLKVRTWVKNPLSLLVIESAMFYGLAILLYIIHGYGITVMDNAFQLQFIGLARTVYLSNGVAQLVLILSSLVLGVMNIAVTLRSMRKYCRQLR